MSAKRGSRCFVLDLAPDRSLSYFDMIQDCDRRTVGQTGGICHSYSSLYSKLCRRAVKIRYVSKFTSASRGSTCDSTAFLQRVSIALAMQSAVLAMIDSV